ncbi:CHAT domain-containing tetratricopeptide repeat protein [Novosphingobium sp.]|uniref:CHAT domain-containing tetratricopeptide repeat protein n=1 Tax=Novosphingobium sp. TaxID=1874826 RepID=UPI00286DDA00|nr:CHAT domain-containing tetratricopeptide repeat protein [Novosphingobium sp.]
MPSIHSGFVVFSGGITRGIKAMKSGSFMALSALVFGCAQPALAKPVDRTTLDALMAKADAYDTGSDPQAGMALYEAALAEAMRLYPASHPAVAAARQGIASGFAAQGKMDEAAKILGEIQPILEKAGPAYLKALASTHNLRGYIAHYRSNLAEAIPAFTTSLAIERSLAKGQPNLDLAKALSNLAGINWEAGKQDQTLSLNAEAIAMGKALNPIPGDIATWYANRVAYLYTLGRPDEAVALAREGISLSETLLPKGHPAVSTLHANMGAMLIRQGKPNTAIPHLRQAYESIEAVSGSPNQNSASMRAMMATALSDSGNDDQAVAFLDQAIGVIEKQLGPESNRALQAHEVRATALMRLGRMDEALTEQKMVLEVRDRRLSSQHRDRMTGRGMLARIALAKGDLALAEKTMREGVALRMLAAPPQHQELLAERALLLLVQSRAASRSKGELVAEAQDIFARAKANAGANPSADLTISARATFQYLAEVFQRAGDTDAAFEAQQWTVRGSVDSAAATAAQRRAAVSDPAAAAMFEDRRKLAALRSGTLSAIEAQLAAPKAEFDLAKANAELSRLDLAIQRLDGDLAARKIDSGHFATVSLIEARGQLRKGDLFIQVTPSYDRFIVTGVSPSATIQYITDTDSKMMRDAVDRLRAALLPSAAGNAFDRASSAAVYRALVSPRLEKELRQTRNLQVSAHGPLGAVPFSLLVADVHGKDFLMDRMSVTRLAGAPRRHSDSGLHATTQMLGMGSAEAVPQSPEQNTTPVRGSPVEGLDRLPPLPRAATELAAIARAIGARSPTILTGVAATESALAGLRIAPGTVVAFATHGLVSGEFEGLREPALLLSASGKDDGLLTASEIARLDLPASWVILSACNTAAGSGPDAPSLSGLAQAFILAGADRIIATHWPVRDDVASAVTAGTLRHSAKGAAPAEAVRRSLGDWRKGAGAKAHPSLWAAFELVSP